MTRPAASTSTRYSAHRRPSPTRLRTRQAVPGHRATAPRTWAPTVSLCALILALTTALSAQSNETFRSWNQPVEPLQIIDNVYYVGASDIAAYLITSEAGHIVIDGGFPETAPLIRDGIETLGFKLSDVKFLLNSHAHFDHSGGLAALAEWTGAEVVASVADAPILTSGGAGDYFISAADNAFPAVDVDRRVTDGDTVQLGDITLTANVTAGHTRGCTSWSMPVDDHGTSRTAVFICSLTLLPGVELIDNPDYPNIVEDYRASLERLSSISCDVFLAAHAQFFDLATKRQAVGDASGNPFVDPEGCADYVRRNAERFEKVLAEQTARDAEPQTPDDGARGMHRHRR